MDDLIPESTAHPPEHEAHDVDPPPPPAPAAPPPATSPETPRRAAWVDAAGLAEGGLLTDVGIILDLATIYLPLVSPILAPAVPTPFAILMLRRGARATLLAAGVATFLVTILAGPHFGWRMGLEVLVGLLLGWAMRHRWHWLAILGAGTTLVATVAFGAAIAMIVLIGLPVHDIVQMLRNGLTALANFIAWLAQLTGQQALWLEVRPELAVVGTFLVTYWPLLFYLYTLCVTVPTIGLYYAVANLTARALGFSVKPFPPRSWLVILRVVGVIVLAPILVPARVWARLRRHPARRGGRPAPATEGAPKR